MYTIGVSGGTCSGKSTLSVQLYNMLLENQIKVKLFNMDDYFKEITPSTIAPVTRKEYPEHNHPSTLDLNKCYLDINTAISSDDYDIVIVEGLFSLYLDEIREKLDLKVYVDLKSDERLIQRLKRFSDHLGQEFDEITSRYLDTVRLDIMN